MTVVQSLSAFIYVGAICQAIAAVARSTRACEAAESVCANADVLLTVVLAYSALVLVAAYKAVASIARCATRAVESTRQIHARRACVALIRICGALVDICTVDAIACHTNRA